MDHVLTMSSSRSPVTNLLGLSLPASLHTYQWPCKPLVISFSLLLHTRDFHTYLQHFQRSIHIHKQTHFLAQLLLMFFKLHVFQEILMDLAGVGSFYAALRIKMSSMVFEFGRCVLFLDETCLSNLGIIQYLLMSP
ncbi:hypothetical protein HanPSC8_Chr13g0577621 [Helianthus annuus]|nr:hypothetical protein HanPSC8_Chr13g0577621 [Helianthus annuus]